MLAEGAILAAEKTGRKGLYIATDAANTERGCRIGLQVRPIPQAPPVYWLLTFLKEQGDNENEDFSLDDSADSNGAGTQG